MKKSFTAGDRGQGVGASAGELIQVQLPLGMLATLEDVERGFFSLCFAAGREVLTAMMEREREALCGPKWEILGFCVLLLIAGNETTTNLIGNLFHARPSPARS